MIKFWWQSGSSYMSTGAKNSIMIAAYPDPGEGNDPEALGLTFHHKGPTFINAYIYCQAATHLVDSSGEQYEGNNLPRPRRSTLSVLHLVFIMQSK